MIEPIVQTYAVPPHIKRQVERKKQADHRKQLKSYKASAKELGTPRSLLPPSRQPLPDKSLPTNTSGAPSSPVSFTSSISSPPPSPLSPPSPPSSRFRFLKKLLTPPQSPELSFTLPPKALRMPDENKQLMRFCTVCASNNNRSMEAHRVLKEHGFNVESFGTGTAVRLPGPAIDKPQVYEFGTPYEKIYQDLKKQNQRLYTANGVLTMLDRNRNIKDHPQQWSKHSDVFDVVITCQEKCFDSVCMDLLHRGAKLCRPVHVVNVEIEDNHQEAKLGSQAILDFVVMVVQSGDPDTDMLEILRLWQKKHQKYPSMYQLCYA